MNWFFIALISPIANAVVNYLDKYLVNFSLKGSGIGALILFSALFSVVLLPIVYFLDPTVLDGLNVAQVTLLLTSGFLIAAAVLFYLYALEDHEVSIVMPLAQLVPVFGFILGYFLLNETITYREFWAALTILFGGLILTLDFTENTSRLKYKLILHMLAATFCYALGGVLYKLAAIDLNFTQSLFWAMLGKVIFGLILLLTVSTYRHQLIVLLTTARKKIIGLNVINEVLGIIAEVSLIFALLLAPVVLVQSVSGLQPIFVFIIGIVFTIWFPQFVRESLAKLDLIQKMTGIIVVTIGVYLLELT